MTIPMAGSRGVERLLLTLGVLAAVLGGLDATPADAHDGWRGGYGWHHRGWGGRGWYGHYRGYYGYGAPGYVYGAPPVVVAPPAVMYAPPPVMVAPPAAMYAPPPVIMAPPVAPSVNLVVPLNFR